MKSYSWESDDLHLYTKGAESFEDWLRFQMMAGPHVIRWRAKDQDSIVSEKWAFDVEFVAQRWNVRLTMTGRPLDA